MKRCLLILAAVFSLTCSVTPALAYKNYQNTSLVSASNQTWSRANPANLNITGNLTIDYWIKPNGFPGTNVQWYIIEKNDFNTTRQWGSNYENLAGVYDINLFISSDGNGGANSKTAKFILTAPLATSTWTHVTLLYDNYATATGTADAYINGVKKTTVMTMPTSIFNGTAIFDIGEAFVSGSPLAGGGFNGNIDEVRVWSRLLSTSTDMNDLYQHPCTFNNGANLQGWWHFDNNAQDSSTNAYDLTNNNSATFASTGNGAFQCFNNHEFWDF